MLTHTLIHVLELVVCALFVLLFVQIYRGYRKQALLAQQQAAERAAAAAAQISARARESILGQRVSSPAPQTVQKVRVRVLTEAAAQEKSLAESSLAPKSSADKPQPRLVKDSATRESAPTIKPQSTQAFANLNAANGISAAPIKASEILLNDYIGEFFSEPVKAAEIMPFKAVGAESALAAKPVQTDSADAVAGVSEVDMAQPAADSAQKELEDDLVITVNAESSAGSPTDRVMSDKVVHAMLDEAKLVCVS